MAELTAEEIEDRNIEARKFLGENEWRFRNGGEEHNLPASDVRRAFGHIRWLSDTVEHLTAERDALKAELNAVDIIKSQFKLLNEAICEEEADAIDGWGKSMILNAIKIIRKCRAERDAALETQKRCIAIGLMAPEEYEAGIAAARNNGLEEAAERVETAYGNDGQMLRYFTKSARARVAQDIRSLKHSTQEASNEKESSI